MTKADLIEKMAAASGCSNVLSDPRFEKGHAGITSLLCVLLKWRSSVFGVINMSYCSQNLFSLEDLKMLRSLSIYASIAIKKYKGLFRSYACD